MSKFFVNRPIFAWVIAIVIMLAGALAIRPCRSRSIRVSRRPRSPSAAPLPRCLGRLCRARWCR